MRRAALRAVEHGAGAPLLIEGAAGHRQVAAARGGAQRRGQSSGFGCSRARATELEQGFPFGVVRQLFERALLEADADERERWLAGAAALAADVLTGAPMPGTRRAPPGPAAERPRLRVAARPVLAGLEPLRRHAAGARVDDLQWCDAPSARALAFIARRLERAAARADPRHAAARSRADAEAATLVADPAVELLRLAPLTEAAVARSSPTGSPPSPTRASCARASR